MNDEEKLEAELGQMKPAALRPEMLRELVAVTDRMTLGDRLLAAWAGMGALAASVIVAVVIWQISAPQPPAIKSQPGASMPSLEAEIRQMLAAR